MIVPIPKLHDIQAFRRELHQFPEYSGREKHTAERIIRFCSPFKPDLVIDHLGGYGFALVFKGKEEGNTLMFRAELDALNIDEELEIDHASRNKDISHKCGHDGHMVILAGLASLLHQHKPKKGKVVLLFEPAEETGKGAEKVLRDPKFQGIIPDWIFALHNVPGFPRGAVVVKDDVFAVASLGLFARLKGHSSHAAFPRHGISPLPALIELQTLLPGLPFSLSGINPGSIVTITYSRLGHFCFGTSPGTAELAATMRTASREDIQQLKKAIVKLIRETGTRHFLDTIIQWHEPFDSTVNHPEAVMAVRSVARHLDMPLIELKEPFLWSEDFGQFTNRFPGAIFGLGAGSDHSDLHTPNYDFPDEIIEPGISLFYELVQLYTS